MFRIITQVALSPSNQILNRRNALHFSSHSAVQKLKCVLEYYRLHNHSRELPSRFGEQVIKTFDKNESGVIGLEDFNHFLKNIGAVKYFSGDELEAIIHEAGNMK